MSALPRVESFVRVHLRSLASGRQRAVNRPSGRPTVGPPYRARATIQPISVSR